MAFARGVQDSVVVVLLVLITVETSVTYEVVAFCEVVFVEPALVTVETVLVTVTLFFGVEVMVVVTKVVDVVDTDLSACVEVSVE